MLLVQEEEQEEGNGQKWTNKTFEISGRGWGKAIPTGRGRQGRGAVEGPRVLRGDHRYLFLACEGLSDTQRKTNEVRAERRFGFRNLIVLMICHAGTDGPKNCNEKPRV